MYLRQTLCSADIQPETVAYKSDKLGICGLCAVKVNLAVELVLDECNIAVSPVPGGGYGVSYSPLDPCGGGAVVLCDLGIKLLCDAVKNCHIFKGKHYCVSEISVALDICGNAYSLDNFGNYGFDAVISFGNMTAPREC